MFTKLAVLLMLFVAQDTSAAEEKNPDYYFMLGEKYMLNEDLLNAKLNFEKAQGLCG